MKKTKIGDVVAMWVAFAVILVLMILSAHC